MIEIVKPLEFPPQCPRGQRVHSRPQALIRYTIAHYGGDDGDAIYRWASEGEKWSEPHHTYEAAIGCAQADYRDRVLDTLDLTPFNSALEPFAMAALRAVEATAGGSGVTLAVMDRVAAYYVSWPDYTRARALLSETSNAKEGK